jgi:hypothetical protein
MTIDGWYEPPKSVALLLGLPQYGNSGNIMGL